MFFEFDELTNELIVFDNLEEFQIHLVIKVKVFQKSQKTFCNLNIVKYDFHYKFQMKIINNDQYNNHV